MDTCRYFEFQTDQTMPHPKTPPDSPFPLDVEIDHILLAPPSKKTRGTRGIEAMREWRRSPDAHFAKLRARLFRFRCKQPEGLLHVITDLGMEEINSPIAEALRALSEHINEPVSEAVKEIPLCRILSHVWMPVRIGRIFSYPRGSKPPPVDLVEFRFEGESFYAVYDGHHRCESAKMRWEKTIPAKIDSVAIVRPHIWRITPNGLLNTETKLELPRPVDVRAAAHWLGVQKQFSNEQTI